MGAILVVVPSCLWNERSVMRFFCVHVSFARNFKKKRCVETAAQQETIKIFIPCSLSPSARVLCCISRHQLAAVLVLRLTNVNMARRFALAGIIILLECLTGRFMDPPASWNDILLIMQLFLILFCQEDS
ncbi:unnamed protein product [Ixodes persulcatus]